MGKSFDLKITSFIDSENVAGNGLTNVPEWARETSTSEWSKAVDEISGLTHLEGEAVSVFADGFTVAGPYNPKVRTYRSDIGLNNFGSMLLSDSRRTTNHL